MDLVQFIRLFLRHSFLIFGTAIVMAVLVFNGTKDEKRTYSSEGLVNTGLVSGYNIESQGGGKTDYFYTSAELDNILNVISGYETNEILCATLLAEVLAAEERTNSVILQDNYADLQLEIGMNLWDSLAVPGDVDQTYANVVAQRDKRGENNVIHEILYGKHELFGMEHVSGVKVAREGKSDMVRLSYTTIDPAICRRTLVLLIQIFTAKHREIKEGQTANVLDYFEEATERSARRLRSAEEALKQFREESKIINYYEQTRFIANKREDLYEEYMNELMNVVSADSAMRNLERQMNSRNQLGLINDELIRKRDTLALVVGELANYQLLDNDTTKVQHKIDSLRAELDRLKVDITSGSVNVTTIQRTPKGTQIDDLLTEWLKNVLAMENASARLQVIEKRKVEFEDIYDAFAPLGSKLKRLEREIDVAESEYMENLHSLNQARLHRQNMLMATNLKVVDVPFFPPAPDPSQRMMLVIVAFLAGFILTLGTVIAMEFFDKTLKKPRWAHRTTELDIIGVLPRFQQKRRYRKRVSEEFLEERPIGLLLQNLKIELSKRELNNPIRVLVLSTRDKEGKSLIGYMLTKYLRSYRAKVAYLTPEDGHDVSNFPRIVHGMVGSKDTFRYFLEDDLFELKSEEALLRDQSGELQGYDYYITELPGLLGHPFPVEIVKNADIILMVARANRTWIDADRKALEAISEISKVPVMLVLNGVEVEYLEESLGDLPKKRSRIRRVFKRFLKSGFSSRSKL